jgi:DNA-directed RNA polymerase subunit M/transcription elongation factor TFIIS
MDFGEMSGSINAILSIFKEPADRDAAVTYLYQQKLCTEKKVYAQYIDKLLELPKEPMTYREFRLAHAIDTWKYVDMERRRFTQEIKVPSIAMESLVCKKCGSRDFTSSIEQTRRADEGATAIYRCTKCNTVITFRG